MENSVKYFIVITFLVITIFASTPVFSAEFTPIQLSLFYPAQIFPKETKVQGLRINLIYGVNDEMTGIDLGVVNKTTGTTQGLQLGLFPLGGVNVTEELEGFQFAGFWGGANLASGDVSGIQISGILVGFNKAKDLNGIQIAAALLGANTAVNSKGMQIATLYNQAEQLHGLQVGIVNVCEQLQGVQIGLANIVKGSNPTFLPLVNARF